LTIKEDNLDFEFRYNRVLNAASREANASKCSKGHAIALKKQFVASHPPVAERFPGVEQPSLGSCCAPSE
jgi:hypothetical protein